jgi:hypothetical protein
VAHDLTAMGLLALVGMWCAGFGGYLLGRKHGVAIGALGMLGLQLCPALLRGQWAGEVATWGLGPAALALAGVVAAPLLAGLAAAFCWPLGLVVLAGRWRCRWTWLAVVPVLFAQLAVGSSPDAHSLRQAEPERRTVPAYVTPEGSAIPMPAMLAPPADPTPRPHGGWLALVGLLACLALGPRAVGVVGVILAVVLVLGTGWLPASGLPPPRPADWWFALAPPGFGRGGSGWAGAICLAGLVGVLAVAARHRVLLAAAGLAVLAEALLGGVLRTPITVVPPDPAIAALPGSAAEVLVWPTPGAPWFQGSTAPAEIDFIVGEHSPNPAWIRHLSAMDGQTVDTRAAETLWLARDERLEDQETSWLLLHRPELRNAAAIEGWLAATIGAPVAVGEEWVLYSL